jgi:hypothetical protein
MLGWAGNRDFAFSFDSNNSNSLSGMYIRPSAFFNNSDALKSIEKLQNVLNRKECIHKNSLGISSSVLVICQYEDISRLHVKESAAVNVDDKVLFFWSSNGLFFGSKNSIAINHLESFFMHNIDLAFSENYDRLYLKQA